MKVFCLEASRYSFRGLNTRVVKLLYLTLTRSDIALATNQASRYIHELREVQLQLLNASYVALRDIPHMAFSMTMGTMTIFKDILMPDTRQTLTKTSPLAPTSSP